MSDLKHGDAVIQHLGSDRQREGRVLELRGANAVVLFYDVGTRLAPVATLTRLADLNDVSQFDNVDGT